MAKMRTKEETLCPDIDCTMCGQIYDRKIDQMDVKQRIEEFARYSYSVCPRCHQPVPADVQNDRAYRKNVDRFIKARKIYLRHVERKNVHNDN